MKRKCNPGLSLSPLAAVCCVEEDMGLSPSVRAGPQGSLTAWLCLGLCQSLCTDRALGTNPSSKQQRPVDLVLDCIYVESASHGGMFAGGFTRDAALLVLHNVSVPEHESLDSFTDFQPHLMDKDVMIFEATVRNVEIPEPAALLHADCNGQEVTCEISQYKAGPGQEEEAPCFISSIHLPGESFSVTVLMKALSHQQHPTLKVPLSPRGSKAMTVEFIVFTHTPSMSTRLGYTVTLDCGLRVSAEDITSVEWRIQHKGQGRSIYMYQPGTEITRDATGSRMDIQKLQDSGDASLIVDRFGVKDEGTYICLVSTTQYHAQQIIQVLVVEPPKVKLYARLPHEGATINLLTCEMSNYYPLDVHVKWSQRFPGNERELTEISESYSSSHRENQDGTFTISSIIKVKIPSSDEEGSIYTCTVSHLALAEPITASMRLDPAAF
ncbi:tapasin-related protein isoform X2 [Rhinatrema bivittatum]|uniref:tapasin-related protein isoform X2 n=1 Tax=Rhinatrema bivittatum TaxID=194408 RepID=UPI00112C7C7C|nr:tapasin-related protein isoform X2 [Rhinatrema bivittatum]